MACGLWPIDCKDTQPSSRYSRARADHDDFELTAGRNWAANPNRRKAPADNPIDDSDSDISAVLYNAIGGSSVIFAAHWQRNMPSDFRVFTLDGVGDDWPLTYEPPEPFYVRVERDFAVSGLAGAPAFPSGEGPPLPPVPLGPMGRRVARDSQPTILREYKTINSARYPNSPVLKGMYVMSPTQTSLVRTTSNSQSVCKSWCTPANA